MAQSHMKHAEIVMYKLPDGLTLTRQKDKWSILDGGVYALSKECTWVYVRIWANLKQDELDSILFNTVEEAYNFWEEKCG